MKPILGIDLGTTKCVASVRIVDEFIEIAPVIGRFSSLKVLPSVFIQPASGKPVVGQDAVNEYGSDRRFRGQLIRNIKRWMKYNYPEGDRPARKFRSGNREFSPAEISSQFLRVLRDAALRETDTLKVLPKAKGLDWNNWLDSVVITVPAYFSPVERKATREAARLAGFAEDAVHLIDEPVAAALSQGVHEQAQQERILVVDLGGGTCDLTLLETGPGVFRELGRFGDNEFGGLEWDLELAKLALRKHPLPNVRHLMGDDGTADYCRFSRLFETSEEAKKFFSTPDNRRLTETVIELADQNLDDDSFGEPVKILRKEFDSATQSLAEYCGKLAERLLESADLPEKQGRGTAHDRWGFVQRVLLVGGGSQLNSVQQSIQRRLAKSAKLEIPPAAQLAVARGAAMFGQLLSKNVHLEGISHPRSPHDVGIMVVPKPVKRPLWSRLFESEKPPAPGQKPTFIFCPLIKCNATLPMDFGCQFPLNNHRSQSVQLDICFRQFTRTKPEGFLRLLRPVVFEDLQLNTASPDDRLQVMMRFDDRYDLHVRAQVRGKDVKVTLRSDDFDGGQRYAAASTSIAPPPDLARQKNRPGWVTVIGLGTAVLFAIVVTTIISGVLGH